MRWWLTLVARGARARSCSCSTCCWSRSGLAWLTELAGLSLALGAFIAGMLIAETEFKHQVETDIRPFHDVLLGPVLHHHRHDARLAAWCSRSWPLVLLLTLLPVLFKLALVTALARVLRRRAPASRCAPACTWRRPASSASCC